jgi:hypothetical protein
MLRNFDWFAKSSASFPKRLLNTAGSRSNSFGTTSGVLTRRYLRLQKAGRPLKVAS